MSDIVIKVENLSKQYRLGDIGIGSLKDDMKRWRYRMMGRGDPFLTIGEENDRTVKSNQQYVWALKDINFEVKKGEVLGIIGRNGAGKSTLLKILSRTTGPTTGSVKIKGRIASLLEVGTGFHGELSGRENIYLNGAIMGMTKAEIKKRFDEIVDFAGVEKYIDTPVKRYSSGMYVRLAFGVAAHLEPEILIVDEVLAVGDAEFQKKALGKMKDVSTKDGRTVLFVSHSMSSAQALCTTGLFLERGRSSGIESIQRVVERYLYGESNNENLAEYNGASGTKNRETPNQVNLSKIELINQNNELTTRFKTSEPIKIRFTWQNLAGVSCTPNFQLKSALMNTVVAMIGSDSMSDWTGNNKKARGSYISEIVIPPNLLNSNDYFISVALDSHSPRVCYEFHTDILKLSIWDPMDELSLGRGMFTSIREDAILWPVLESSFKKIS
jgi:lipopolysaccharide transport system ATP-binding protein